MMPRIKQLTDVAELETLLNNIPTAATLQEIRDHLPARRE